MMNVLKRIGNFVWRTIQETIGLIWLVATAIVTFTVWIVFCAGMYLWIVLGRILDLFCPNTWDDVAELLSAISDYLLTRIRMTAKKSKNRRSSK